MPDKSKFFSSLKDSGINEKEYERAVNVWKLFKINNFGHYHDLYLKTDVLLLVDVFEKFVKICLNYYRLDPCHFFSSSRLSWDATLKMTKIKLELISDVTLHLLFEWEVVFHILQKDTVKLMEIINLLCIGMQIICMIGQ